MGPPFVSHGVLTPYLIPVNIALSFLIPSTPARTFPTQPRLLAAISLLVFTGVVFRSELALLLAPIAVYAIFVTSPVRLIRTGIISAILSIGKNAHRFDMPPVNRRKTKDLRSSWIPISGVNIPFGRNCTGYTSTSTKAKVLSGV